VLDPAALLVLRTVVATESVAAAATRLGLTPSAVSQRLSTLQRDTGLSLFDRRGRGIQPTAAARVLADAADPVIRLLDEIDVLVADLGAGRVGDLVIRYLSSAGSALIPSVTAGLVAEFPRLRLDLRLADLPGSDLPPPDIDLRVAGQPAGTASGPSADDRYDVEPLVDDCYVAILPLTHPAARRAEVRLADLALDLWVDNTLERGHCRQTLLAACAQAGFVPGFKVTAHDHAGAVAFVAAGVGVAVLPRLGLGEVPNNLVARPVVHPSPVRRIEIAIRADVAREPAARRAVALLKEHATAFAR
jgi:DNA-binding transcriptional LysR family regulator